MKPTPAKNLDAYGASIPAPPGTMLFDERRPDGEPRHLFTLEGEVDAAARIERHFCEQLKTSGYRVNGTPWNGSSFAIKATKAGLRCEVDAFAIAPDMPLTVLVAMLPS